MKKTSSVIGAKVRHRNNDLGEGSVTNIDNRYISVRFDSKNDEIKEFLFPDAFVGKMPFLESKDPGLNKIISDAVLQWTCSKCGTFSKEVTQIAGVRLCQDCKKQSFICITCKKLVFRDQIQIKENLYGIQCDDCYKQSNKKCPICNQYSPKNEFVITKYSEEVCSHCCITHFVKCNVCHGFIPKENAIICNYRYICPECASEAIVECSVCGKTFLRTELKENQLCTGCLRKRDYYNFLEKMEFSDYRVEELSFYRFEKSKTVRLFGRLQHYYESVFPHKIEEEASFDILLLDTIYGKLVIMYIIPEECKNAAWELARGGCTPTELKTQGYWHLFYENKSEEKTVKEVSPYGYFHIWVKPYLLNAHTKANEDYGDIWNGDTLVYEGSKYGDTSRFYIVGYITKTI